jgi:transcriptional regulator with XRE-family HTH domain
LRLARNWTIDDLAQRAAVNKMTVSAIERGHNYTRDSLDAIARAFDLDNASSLDARLHDWAAKLAANLPVNDAVREWMEIYEVLSVDAERFAELVRYLRGLARDRRAQKDRLTHSPEPSAPEPSQRRGTGRKPRGRSRR